jgi:ferredoxin-NADP reductase
MSLHDDPDRAIVMIAGGIGITPFISMLRSEAQAERPRPMALLYSNHRPENAAYLHELRELEQRLGGFRLVLTMTGMKDSEGWAWRNKAHRCRHGERGHRDSDQSPGWKWPRSKTRCGCHADFPTVPRSTSRSELNLFRDFASA